MNSATLSLKLKLKPLVKCDGCWMLAILSSSEQTTYETVAIRTDGLPLQMTVTTHYIACGL